MSENTSGIRAVLSQPKVYELWSRVIGGERARTEVVRRYVRPKAGDRVLDLGCGPAELLPFLGDVEYVGVDLSEEYVERARERFGDRAEFRAGDATAIDDDLRDFDLVLAFGVLHHVDDEGARGLLEGAARALRPDGRAVTLDNAFVPGQSRIARAIISRDRGQHVRAADAYAPLAAGVFGQAQTTVRHDLLRMPYTHLILELSAPSVPAAPRR
jgi:SAM-dependent methyltransferase